jgi:hypothetical protein
METKSTATGSQVTAPDPVLRKAAAPRTQPPAAPAPLLHFVSASRKPLKVKNHESGQIRVVNYGDYVPEASHWKANVQYSNEKMGILRRVDGPPPGYKAPKPKVAAPVAEKPAEPTMTTADAVLGALAKGS